MIPPDTDDRFRGLMHFFPAILILISGLCSGSETATAIEVTSEHTRYIFNLAVNQVDGRPDRISGTLRIRNWDTSPRNYCLFLPFNWSGYGSDRGSIKRFSDITAQKNLPMFSGGSTNISVSKPAEIEATDIGHIVRLNVPPGWSAGDDFSFEIESILPKLPDSSSDEYFFDGFLPIISHCSEYGESSLTSPVPIIFEGTITTPEGWHYVGSGRLKSTNDIEIFTQSRSYAFVLTRNMKRYAVKSGRIEVDVLYKTEEFKTAAATITTALPILEKYLGDYPFQNLNIVETLELQRNNIPELISINRPSQSFANKIQKDWLNWMHWTAVTQLVRQWYGASIDSLSDDEWLISGIVEFLTLETLTQMKDEYDLIQADKDGKRLLTFNYLQMSEFTAASLRRLAPYTALTDLNRKSLESSKTQHGLAYIRHAFAMRQIMNGAGKREFSSFLRALTAQHQNRRISPDDFYNFTQKLPSPFSPVVRDEIANSLMRWWTDYGWPDFSIDKFSVTESGGKYLSDIVVVQNGLIDFAPIVEVKDSLGGTVKQRAKRNPDGKWSASIPSQFKPEKTIVDPDHETFDSDRFNNHTGLSGFIFFPGSGNTIHDDKYSVVWFPYGYRLPGEPPTIGLGSALFKYVQSGILGRVEHAPSTKQWAYQFRQLYAVPDWAIKGELSINYSFDNDRTTEINAIRSPIINSVSQIFSGQAKIRHKDHPGEPEQAHETFAADLSLKPKGQNRRIDYNLSTEGEVSPKQGRGFSYERLKALAAVGYNLSERISFGVRYFRGKTLFDGSPPQSALFKPNEIKEANLKVDVQGLERTADIVSWEGGISLPFYAPIPKDTLVLARQIQWRVYYDWGKAYDLHYEYHSRGLGIVMPLGGDISGVGSLAVTRFTLLAVLNSSAGSDKSKRPGFVFDITGEL